MATIEFGLFDGIGRAGRVVSALGACGFSPEDISLVAYENEDRALSMDPTANSATCRTSQIRAFDDDLSQALLGAHALPVGVEISQGMGLKSHTCSWGSPSLRKFATTANGLLSVVVEYFFPHR